MITKEEARELLYSTETYRIERTVSTSDMDKFQEAICAFSNDLPNSRKKGYLIIGANDNGRLSGLKVTDALLKKIAAIRSDGNILPLPVMTVESFEYEDIWQQPGSRGLMRLSAYCVWPDPQPSPPARASLT